jgi:hypothetical protein
MQLQQQNSYGEHLVAASKSGQVPGQQPKLAHTSGTSRLLVTTTTARPPLSGTCICTPANQKPLLLC